MDALSHHLAGSDHKFDGEGIAEDVDNVCTVCMSSRQIVQDDPKLLVKEANTNPVLIQVTRTLCEERLAKPMFR